MRPIKKNAIPIIFVISLILTSCTPMIGKGARSYISQVGNINPKPSSFVFCTNYGCREKTTVSLSPESWLSIRKIFAVKNSDPARERQQIIDAVSLLETIVGPITETEYDEPGTFPGFGKGNQLDCVAESLNTSTYLVMMEEDNLITEHNVLGPAQRGFMINFAWPHFAPVIEEKGTGKWFVVDSWFYKNGAKPVIISFQEWKNGWKP